MVTLVLLRCTGPALATKVLDLKLPTRESRTKELAPRHPR